jgi:hypothetical protein
LLGRHELVDLRDRGRAVLRIARELPHQRGVPRGEQIDVLSTDRAVDDLLELHGLGRLRVERGLHPRIHRQLDPGVLVTEVRSSATIIATPSYHAQQEDKTLHSAPT